MEPLKLLHLLRHLSHEVSCPHCKAKICAEKIQIFTSTDTSAFLSIHCAECGQYLFAHAFLNVPSLDQPASSAPDDQELTFADTEAAKAFLDPFEGNISDLFS